MNQPYVVLEIAHSIHGRFQQIRLSHRSLKCILGAGVLFLLTTTVLLGAYARMSWRAHHYDQLQADFAQLQARFQELQKVSTQRREAVSSLANLANEVTAEYGLARNSSVTAAPAASDAPKVKETIEQFNFLKTANYATLYHRYAYSWQTRSEPTGWPVQGLLRSSFGGRADPFSGEGEFHTGIDLQASKGTPVHVTADGVVARAEYSPTYGKLVVVDHGNGFQTYYAHLSQFLVVTGQEIRSGEVLGLSGGTGRATSPHLHYEVRVKGAPVNPYRFLTPRTQLASRTTRTHNDLGL